MVIGENMTQALTSQNYLIVEQNIVTNIVVWDGDTTQWTPPVGSIALVQADTTSLVWKGTKVEVEPATIPPTYTYIYSLNEEVGVGDIGFTWDGTYLITNQVQPTVAPQPVAQGAQTL
jgi:hypothetical protein